MYTYGIVLRLTGQLELLLVSNLLESVFAKNHEHQPRTGNEKYCGNVATKRYIKLTRGISTEKISSPQNAKVLHGTWVIIHRISWISLPRPENYQGTFPKLAACNTSRDTLRKVFNKDYYLSSAEENAGLTLISYNSQNTTAFCFQKPVKMVFIWVAIVIGIRCGEPNVI